MVDCPDFYFDDGFRDTYDNAAPLMSYYKGRKIMSVITGKVGQPRYMDVRMLKDLIKRGWLIASHSVTHPQMHRITMERVQRELKDSKQWILDRLGVEPYCFVLPYGGMVKRQHVDKILEVRRMAEELYPFCAKKRITFHNLGRANGWYWIHSAMRTLKPCLVVPFEEWEKVWEELKP